MNCQPSIIFLMATITVTALLLTGCVPTAMEAPTTTSFPASATPQSPGAPVTPPTMGNLIPKPVLVTTTDKIFTLTNTTSIYVEPGDAEITAIGRYLADKLRPATGFPLEVFSAQGAPAPGNIYLTTNGGDAALGEEGYELTITHDSVILKAYQPAGLFRGLQTIRQLLPAAIESTTAQAGPWLLPAGTIRDYPRFAWRGAMLDVARHLFGVAEVKRYLDLMAYYKLNRLHLHLTDDQGWRLAITAWPDLTTIGGSTEVGGGTGGFYTQADYAEIVAYAQGRYIVVVPEIDMPGHINAALASYAELNCSGKAPKLYTGTDVGFSSLCIGRDITFKFVDDVVREIAALTPGPYIHIGGDEAATTSDAGYKLFVERVQTIVQAYNKQMVGWEEIAQIQLLPTSIAQHWNSDFALQAARQGAKVIMSPADRAFLDMKYDASTALGLNWASTTDVQDAYTWDPVTQVDGMKESDILGVEAPLWSETLETMDDTEFMAFPRLLGLAELGWSPPGGAWDEYRVRLGTHGPRLTALGVNFYAAPQVPWIGIAILSENPEK
jgi:hexosaminidase